MSPFIILHYVRHEIDYLPDGDCWDVEESLGVSFSDYRDVQTDSFYELGTNYRDGLAEITFTPTRLQALMPESTTYG